jgi:prevent-host-death family protein
MRSVGVRELKAQASEIIRLVREEGQEIELTFRGQTVGRIIPIRPTPPQPTIAEILAEMDRLADEISQHWPEGVSAVDAVAEGRNRL